MADTYGARALTIYYFWWRDIIRFANRVARLPDGVLWRELVGSLLTEGWVSEVAKLLCSVSYQSKPNNHKFIDEQAALHACVPNMIRSGMGCGKSQG